MSGSGSSIVIVGGGVFGLTAALELRARGWTVTLLEAGTLPREEAASTDISKAVRPDYGADAFYSDWMLEALEGWRAWNREWDEPLFHETGFLFLSQAPLAPGGFEYESHRVLSARGLPLERLTSGDLARRYPAWAAERFVDGYFNPRAGWAESGKVIRQLGRRARDQGVLIVEQTGLLRLRESGGRTSGVETRDGQVHEADAVLLACGSWSEKWVPELAGILEPTAQVVLYFRAPDVGLYQAPRFPGWGADIARTGFYGFPALADGTLKVANHGPGFALDPDAPRVVPGDVESRFRAFLRETFPGLAEAPLLGGKVCLYTDTPDGNFWVDAVPGRKGLFLASGGSGHAFKFAPVLGELVADVVEHRPNPRRNRFAARTFQSGAGEGARWKGATGAGASEPV